MFDYVRNKNKKKTGRGLLTRSGGFSLMEMIIAVAIAAVLISVLIISVPKYVRSMKQLERDGAAKEIFVAAQNNLSLAYSQGYLNRTKFGESEYELTRSDDSKGIYYFVVSANDSALNDTESVLSLMLPEGSIDAEVRDSGNYIIRYQKDAGLVLDVFYSETTGLYGLGHQLLTDEYRTLMTLRGDDARLLRRSYGADKSVVGYYGGVEKTVILEAKDLPAPTLRIENGSRLTAYVTPGEPTDPLRLIITGADSGAQTVYELSTTSFSEFWEWNGTQYQYELVLDDVTESGKRFCDVFKDADANGKDFVPGENLVIKAQAYTKDSVSGRVIRVADSSTQTVNSLFASLNASADGWQAAISNIRHLENLCNTVSGFNGTLADDGVKQKLVTGAVQTTDLSWTDFCKDIDSTDPDEVQIITANGPTAQGCFMPVTPYASLDYDGGKHSVTGVTVNTSGNAGLFGTLTGGSVKDLTLIDFNISSSAGDAGALVGSMTGTNISGVLAYNDTRSSSDDSALAVTSAAENAGGLIGTMAGGSVKSCAAALYVSAKKCAGGLIGSASGESVSVSSSYSGGHTVNARFRQDYLTGLGRVNVQGGLAAGGLVGQLAGVSGKAASVKYSYSTASVTAAGTGTAGGLIGILSDADISDCYAAGYVRYIEGGTSGNYVGKVTDISGCTFTGINYFLSNLSSQKVKNEIAAVTGVSGKDTAYPDFIFVGDAETKRQSAYIYDDTLKVEYGGKFYFPTVDQLIGTKTDGAKHPGITDIHYGDWQVPYLDSLDFAFINGDRLYLEIDPAKLTEKNKEFFILSLTGDKSGDEKSVFFMINAGTLNTDGTLTLAPTIINQGSMGKKDGNDVIVWPTTPKVNNVPYMYTENGKIIIVLDDITVAGRHFAEIFDGTGLIPGENIMARLVIGNDAGLNEIAETGGATENSLFAKGTTGSGESVKSGLTDGNAVIQYIRHLQNLDPAVSGVDSRITTAVLNNELDWSKAGPKYPAIFNMGSTKSVGYFNGIYNKNLKEFDGRNNSLVEFVFSSAVLGDMGISNAGLFRYVDSELNVHNLRLKDCTVGDESTVHAGSVIAQSNYCKITLDTVLADAKTAAVLGKSSAGGLIGLAGGASTVTINNSAASVCVHATAGPAGGLVANLDGSNGVITKSYAGGHTVDGAYVTKKAADYNIRSDSAQAGGLVGIATGPKLEITESFGAASVSAPTTQPAGGIVGGVFTSSPLKLGYVYAIAPVYNVRTTSTGAVTSAGAIVGQANGQVADSSEASTSVYYLPELYVGNEDKSALYGVAAIGNNDSFAKTPGFAYYQKDGSTNLIAAKTYENTMQVKTYAFDTALGSNRHDSTREYPFSIWTSFDFDETLTRTVGYTFGTYYGDWQPIDPLETVPHTISFSYKNPLTGATVSMDGEILGVQDISENETNRVLTPYIAPFEGWEITGWKVTYKDKNKVSKTITMETDTGYLELTEDKCYGNITAEAVFEEVVRDENYCTLSFFYDPSDPTGANYKTKGISVFEQIGKTETYPKNTDLSTIESPIRVIESYNFVGWYDSPDFTGTRYDLEDDESSTKLYLEEDLVLYAKYERLEYYNITIDFMYSPADDPTHYEHLQSVPRYRIGEQPQYRIQCVKGKNFKDDVPLPNVGTNFKNPSLTDYDANTADTLEQRQMYINTDGTSIHIESLVDSSEEAGSTDINLIVVYQIVDMSQLDLKPYTIHYVLKDTASDGSKYQKNSEYTYNPYKGQDIGSVYFMAPVGTTINVRPKDEGQVPGTSLDLAGFEVDEIEKVTISEDESKNVVHVYYTRREFVLTFNSLGGSYVKPETVVYGTPLEAIHPKADAMERQGYAFESTKGSDGWTILDLGVNFQDDTSIPTKYTWNQNMPAANIVAWANWESKQVDYRVMFWYENSDSDNPYDSGNYSYMGSLSDKKYSGTEITSSDYKNYPGMSTSGHTTHTLNCYPGIGDAIETETKKVKGYTYSFKRNGTERTITLNADGTKWVYNSNEYDRNGLKIKYSNSWYDVTQKETETTVTSYFYGGKEITIAGSTTQTGYVSTWTCTDGTPGSGKCIYVGGTWYLYTGTTNSGKTAPCEAPKYDWIDTNNFTFNDKYTETKTVSSDGTTVLNVYFTRNTYTLMFYSDKKGRCMVDEHTHTEDCYAYYCPGAHFHTDACLTCNKVEHTHTVDCCSLIEHTHSSICCSIVEHKHTSACCTLTEHTHSAACCTLIAHTHTGAACCSINAHTHSIDNGCYTIASSSPGNKISGIKASDNRNKIVNIGGVDYYSQYDGLISGWQWHKITFDCPKAEHTHNGTNCSYTKCGYTYEHTHGIGCNHNKCGYTYEHKHGTGCNHDKCGYTYEHTHGTGCNTAACAVGYEHTHGVGCNTSACTVGYEHKHTKVQGCFNGCSYPDHVHNANCIKYLVCSLPEHTHGPDCSKNLNGTKYLAGIIQAKYNEDIHEYFPIKNSDVDTWDDANSYVYGSSRKDALYSAYISAIDRMPAMPSGMTVGYFTNYAFSGSKTYYVYYYLETIPGGAYDRTTTLNGTTKYYKAYKTITFKGDGVYLTRDEEFHTIEGFERYAYQIGDKGSVKADSSSTTQYSAANNSDSSKPKAYFYYTRNTSVLEYYVESSTPVSTDDDIYYGEPLAAYELSGDSLTNPYGPDYTFDGWYADPGFSNKLDFSQITMPLGKLAVYGRWAPPTYKVTFNADYVPTAAASAAATYKAGVTKKSEGMTVKYDPTDATLRTFIVEKNANISDYITDAKGFILDSYTPEKSGYTFEGWYYDLDSTKSTIEKQPFISSIAITEPITVYADWKIIENAGALRDVTVYYYHALQNKPIQKETVYKDTYSVGERPSFTAPDIYGYYPVTMVQFLTVQSKTEGSANSITFFYMPISEWNYRTEYYVSYRNYETDTDGVFKSGTFSEGTSSYLICSTDGIPAYDEYVNVEFKFPEGYADGYRLVKYEANGSVVKTTNTLAQLKKNADDDEPNVVKFYIEPDPGKFLITDRVTTYDGTSQTLRSEDVTSATVFAFPNKAYDTTYTVDLPDFALDDPTADKTRTLTTHYYNSVSAGYSVEGGTKAFIANEYRYFLADRRSIDDTSLTEAERKLINAGAYRMNGYVVLSVTGIAEGETSSSTRTYLEWKNVNYDLNLRIQPRPVTITSTTDTRDYDPLLPLVRSNLDGPESTWDIKIEGPNDGKPAFVDGDGASYYFAVDAFRMDKGTSDNAFSYVLNEGTEKFNYYITVKFGTLTVN